MMKKGSFPYWQSLEFRLSLDSAPDIVLILMGTNDAKDFLTHNLVHEPRGENSREFVGDYIDMIRTFEDLESHPVVFVIVPPPLYKGSERWLMSQEVVNTELPSLIR